tara:strand:+ start:312 stop:878 length:567 start_codon:yes stop_codon:yes gene_type:complete
MYRDNPYGGRTILLERDCEGLLIPHGHPLMLNQGSAVRITQALGDNFTVEVQGNLVLILGDDRDALGFEPILEEQHALLVDPDTALAEKCWYQMKRCYDPEIPVNIVDLGLVYDCKVIEKPNVKHHHVDVTMTLTAPACGMGPVIIEEVKRKILALDGVEGVEVHLTFEPPWSRENMSAAAKLQLGML